MILIKFFKPKPKDVKQDPDQLARVLLPIILKCVSFMMRCLKLIFERIIIMGFTWNSSDLAALADPHFIDKLGHYVHGHQAENYTFSMNVMGYQAMYYTAKFEEIVKRESSIEALKTEVKQVCRGMFGKTGTDGWEVSFRAEALIRNALDPNTHLPLGEIDYATDLVYSNTILFSLQQTGNKIFEEWARNVGLIETLEEKPEIHSHPTNILPISVDQEKIEMTM